MRALVLLGGCMLSNNSINILLYYLDRDIRDEIERICDPEAVRATYDSLVTAEDVAIAKSMGIAF
jgi:hypothetical protein